MNDWAGPQPGDFARAAHEAEQIMLDKMRRVCDERAKMTDVSLWERNACRKGELEGLARCSGEGCPWERGIKE